MSVEGRATAGQGRRGAPLVVLSLNIGSSSLKASIRDPRLRMHVSLSGLDGDAGDVTIGGPSWASPCSRPEALGPRSGCRCALTGGAVIGDGHAMGYRSRRPAPEHGT
jgi:hypothetical protein